MNDILLSRQIFTRNIGSRLVASMSEKVMKYCTFLGKNNTVCQAHLKVSHYLNGSHPSGRIRPPLCSELAFNSNTWALVSPAPQKLWILIYGSSSWKLTSLWLHPGECMAPGFSHGCWPGIWDLQAPTCKGKSHTCRFIAFSGGQGDTQPENVESPSLSREGGSPNF